MKRARCAMWADRWPAAGICKAASMEIYLPDPTDLDRCLVCFLLDQPASIPWDLQTHRTHFINSSHQFFTFPSSLVADHPELDTHSPGLRFKAAKRTRASVLSCLDLDRVIGCSRTSTWLLSHPITSATNNSTQAPCSAVKSPIFESLAALTTQRYFLTAGGCTHELTTDPLCQLLVSCFTSYAPPVSSSSRLHSYRNPRTHILS